jgi:hypothetical protein
MSKHREPPSQTWRTFPCVFSGPYDLYCFRRSSERSVRRKSQEPALREEIPSPAAPDAEDVLMWGGDRLLHQQIGWLALLLKHDP